MNETATREKVTLITLQEMKARGEPITWLTGYDYPTALVLDRAGIDMILVGDSAAMTVLGHETTLPATMEEMLTFTAAVSRATKYAYVVGDMPFLSYQVSTEEAIRNAGRFLSEGGADAVKLEGGRRVASTIRAITEAGIAAIGHIGLTPQAASVLGGYRVQGRTAQSGSRLVDDAVALAEAGAVALLVECVPPPVTKAITEHLDIPVLGLGSGLDCDGQLLIVHDMLGLFDRFTPKFVKRYADLGTAMRDAFVAYHDDVKARRFPGPEHVYTMLEEAPDEEPRLPEGAVEAHLA